MNDIQSKILTKEDISQLLYKIFKKSPLEIKYEIGLCDNQYLITFLCTDKSKNYDLGFRTLQALLYIAYAKRIYKLIPSGLLFDDKSWYKDYWQAQKVCLVQNIVKRHLIDYKHLENDSIYKQSLPSLHFEQLKYSQYFWCDFGGHPYRTRTIIEWKIGKNVQKPVIKASKKFKVYDISFSNSIVISIRLDVILETQAYHYRLNRLEKCRKIIKTQLERWKQELWRPPNGFFAKQSITFSSRLS